MEPRNKMEQWGHTTLAHNYEPKNGVSPCGRIFPTYVTLLLCFRSACTKVVCPHANGASFELLIDGDIQPGVSFAMRTLPQAFSCRPFRTKSQFIASTWAW